MRLGRLHRCGRPAHRNHGLRHSLSSTVVVLDLQRFWVGTLSYPEATRASLTAPDRAAFT
ncbi:MAG: hypothetical protein ACRDRO_07915 [Pseudonocardiaceae bacterium]